MPTSILIFLLGTFFQGATARAAADAPEPPAESTPEGPGEEWSFHFQATTVSQAHPSFTGVDGPNSLTSTGETHTSFTTTLFLGRKLWTDGELYFNPEVSAGSGFSSTHGLAGYPNGEIYRVDSPSAKFNLSRLYLHQSFGMGGIPERIEGDKNQLSKSVDQSRIVVNAGKFSLNDFFDSNTYSHDPRTQFLNWALMDAGTWDYAADTRGYTWGVEAEFIQASWTFRVGVAMEPAVANQLDFDTDIVHAHGDNAEFEYRYQFLGHPGAARLLGFANHAHMGSYSLTLSDPAFGGDIAATRDYRTKYGLSLNLEQELTADVGVFSRVGWDDGATESWAFTEIDRTLSAGVSVRGNPWNRNGDRAGLALILNGLSKDHADYLSAGGLGFIIGDGPGMIYAPEQILEFYYLAKVVSQFFVTADIQYVIHPAYNEARGPVPMGSLRLHYEF